MPASVFAEHLTRYGPDRKPAEAFTLPQARTYCRRLARQHYENFLVASVLLPRSLREHFYPIYAWCRWADDLADETSSPAESLRLLAWWQEELESLFAGRPRHVVTIALQPTVQNFEIPSRPFLDLLSAFRQDQQQTRYQTFDELLDYCRRSANPVGRLVLYLGSCHDERRGLLADQICSGLQLANFWQDIARDWLRGRLYIPSEVQAAHGVIEADFARGTATPALRSLVQSQVEQAESKLHSGAPLIELMPSSMQAQVNLFLQGGLSILAAIRRAEFDVWSRRPTVSKLSQFNLLTKAWWARFRGGSRKASRA